MPKRKEKLDYECPCGGTFSVSLEPPSVMHTIPMCQQFLQLEPADFVAMVNDRREQS